MKRAAIDIGSNSVLLLIGEVEAGKIKIISDHSDVSRLGKNLDRNGILDSESKQKTYEILSRYRQIILDHHIPLKDVVISATEAARVAGDFADFRDRVLKELGLSISVITAQAEAYYSALGIATSTKESTFLICDLGGASTELIEGTVSPFEIKEFVSLPIGSVRSRDWLESSEFLERWGEIQKLNDQSLKRFKGKTLLAIAGTLTSFACFHLNLEEFDADAIDDLSLEIDEFIESVEKLGKSDQNELLKRFPYLSKRIPTLYSGCLSCCKILEHLQVSKIDFSTRGLRFGLLKEGQIRKEFIYGSSDSL